MARVNGMTDMADIMSVMDVQPTLKNKYFCITGHLGKPRAEIESLIVAAGGIVDKTVRCGTTYLITNADWTKNSTKGKVSSKFAQAQKFNVKIISEAQFFSMLSTSQNA